MKGGDFIDSVDGRQFALVRDKDIASCLNSDQRIGFMGSDTYGELSPEDRAEVLFRPLADTALRFTLASPVSKARITQEKIDKGEELNIVTSYPRATEGFSDKLGAKLRIVSVLGGSVEIAPVLFDDVDAVIDITETGATLEQNDMKIVVDNLGAISVGAVWRIAKEEQ